MAEKKEQKPGKVKKFLTKMVEKLDKKLEEKAKNTGCGCSGDDKGGGSSCCN